MSSDSEVDVSEEVGTVATAEEAENRLNLQVEIEEVAACRRHVTVTVPEADIATIRDDAVAEIMDSVQIPGFRTGKAPKQLVQKRFRTEILDQVKQKVLLNSMEQLSEEQKVEPIGQPNIDVETLDIPETGDFRYSFEVEVRPDFEVPDVSQFTVDRPAGEITEQEFTAFKEEFLASYATREPVERAVTAEDALKVDWTFTYNGDVIREARQTMPVKSAVSFEDARLDGFDTLVVGANAGDTVTASVTISEQSPNIEMRGETVDVSISIAEVLEVTAPELSEELLGSLGLESADELDERLRESMGRQLEYNQRQTTREQILAQLTESADWDLPESIVREQTENALRREILEMTQAGFTSQQIASRRAEMRQTALQSTREALKQHFVLDAIAEENDLDASDEDIELEIMRMAFQTGESPRKVRARLVKSGMIENMEAQLRERAAVDWILERCQFNDTEREPLAVSDVVGLQLEICGAMHSSLVDDGSADSDSSEESE